MKSKPEISHNKIGQKSKDSGLRIQLTHPAGKKAITMEKGRYEPLKKAILNCLKIRGISTHKEILQNITEEFKKNKIIFEGSLEWHMEWVKLDLEAGGKIKRVEAGIPVRFKFIK